MDALEMKMRGIRLGPSPTSKRERRVEEVERDIADAARAAVRGGAIETQGVRGVQGEKAVRGVFVPTRTTLCTMMYPQSRYPMQRAVFRMIQ
jgi:hypothetical protein